METLRRREEPVRPASVHQQRAVFLKQRQHLFQVQRRRLHVGLGALGDLARALDEAPLALGILQQQAHDVGVDRVERRVEHQIEHGLDRQ